MIFDLLKGLVEIGAGLYTSLSADAAKSQAEREEAELQALRAWFASGTAKVDAALAKIAAANARNAGKVDAAEAGEG